MSLILLFTSKKGAIISSDKRVIDFYAFVILGNKITKREAHATIIFSKGFCEAKKFILKNDEREENSMEKLGTHHKARP